MDFLRLLEKDNPRYVLCTLCLKLHSRLSRELEHQYLVDAKHFQTPRECGESKGSLHVGESLDPKVVQRETVELILRAASLGPKFGLSIDAVASNKKCDAYSEAGRVTVTCETRGARSLATDDQPAPSTSKDHISNGARPAAASRYPTCGERDQGLPAQGDRTAFGYDLCPP